MDVFTLIIRCATKVVKSAWLYFIKLYIPAVNRDMDEAFNLALSDWSEHAPTHSDTMRLRTAAERYIQNPDSYKELDPDTQKFIDCLKKRLSEHPKAHNYLMLLRTDEQANSEELNLQEHRKTQVLVQNFMAQMSGRNLQDISELFKKLPLNQGVESIKSTLEKMHSEGRIPSEEAKKFLLEIALHKFEYSNEMSKDATQLRETGDNPIAETFEEIHRILMGDSKQSLTTTYEKYQKQAQKYEIKVLQKLIDTAQITLSFIEARNFYEHLIELAPTPENHFNYALMLQSLNDFEEAISHYEAVLQLYQELSDHNTEAYKLDVVTTLNNLGNLLCQTNEFKRAQDCYQEALQIYQDLSKQNPEAYKPNIARTLNNLGNLLKKLNEYERAEGYYKRALEIRRELARQNPESHKFAVDVAGTLNNLGNLLKNIDKCEEAQTHYEEALQIYRDLDELSPKAYKPNIAQTLNNLGNLLCDINEYGQARPLYEEVLGIYRTLEELNPEAYQPKVAMILNNLAALYINLEETEAAEKAYQEALDIYRELAIRHPRAYEINCAKILVMGAVSLDKSEENLEEAKAILSKYPEVPEAQGLLSLIEGTSKKEQ